jgi:hypothetical protein
LEVKGAKGVWDERGIGWGMKKLCTGHTMMMMMMMTMMMITSGSGLRSTKRFRCLLFPGDDVR